LLGAYITCTKPDILFGAGLVSNYMKNLKTSHFQTTKRILCFFKDISNYDLFHPSSPSLELIGHSDRDWAGNYNGQKSTRSFVFYLSERRKFIWSSKKQFINIALSTCEAELYICNCSLYLSLLFS